MRFFAELAHARANFPGVEQRTAMLEKCDDRIKNRLTKALTEDYINPARMVYKIMMGDRILYLDSSDEDQSNDFFGDTIGLISPSIVQEGAAILEQIELQDLFPRGENLDDWDRDNYRKWRQTYLAAAEHQEALLVGRS